MKKAVLISCFSWYEGRLSYIEEFLNKRGYEVTIVLSDFSNSGKIRDRHLSNKDNVYYITPPAYKRNISLSRLWSHYRYSKQAAEFVKRDHFDLVYALIPPNSLASMLAKYKRKMNGGGYSLVFDIIDLWPESFPKGKSDFFLFRFWRGLRNRNLNIADIVVTECQFYQSILADCVNTNKFQTFHLVKPPLQQSALSEPTDRDSISVAYLGSINHMIDITRICDVLDICKQIAPVKMKIIGDGESKDELIQALKSKEIDVEFYGKIFDERRKYQILGNCDFGVNIYKKGVGIGLTMKSVDYFQMGLPILNSIRGDTEWLVQKYGVGINVDDIDIEKLTSYIADREQNRKRVQQVFDTYFNENTIDDRLLFLERVMK